MNGRIRVALVCTSLNQMGGKNVHFKNMYLRLREKEIDVTIILSSTIEKEHFAFLLQEGVASDDIIFIPSSRKWLILPYVLDLRKILVSRNINIVHTFQIQSDAFGCMAALFSGIKCVISQQESKIFEENISIFKELFYKLANCFMKHFIKKTIVVSNALKKELVLLGLRPEAKVDVIPLGVNISSEYLTKGFSFAGLKERRPLIGSITRLNKEKGMDRFIRAMPYILGRVPQAKFIIVGMGDEKDRLMRCVNDLHLGAVVEFKPWTNPVFDILEKIDIFVMPSIREGCPTALLEALAFSRPVVASYIDGINELIENGRTGVMLDTSDPEVFAEGVIDLCENPDKAIIMGEEGGREILSRFTLDREISRYKELYREVLVDNSK